MIRIDIATPASRLTALIGSLLVIALAALPWWGSAGALRLTTEIAYYIALAQLWNLLAGYAGLVSIGQQAYVGIGAYALFALTGVWGLPVYLALVLSGVVAGLLALPIALIVFRLKGAYIAIGTWVIAETLALAAGLSPALGGGSGLSMAPAIMKSISPDKATREAVLYLLTLGTCVAVFLVIYGLMRSRHGLALTAIRDSERASMSLGVNTFATKLTVYLATAACSGLIGALIFLQKLRVSPQAAFSINDWTAVVIFMVVIGGIGTLEGTFIGVGVYFILRELLADYGTVYMMLLGALAIGVMLWAPKGIWGLWNLRLFPVERRISWRDE